MLYTVQKNKKKQFETKKKQVYYDNMNPYSVLRKVIVRIRKSREDGWTKGKIICEVNQISKYF